MAYQTNILRVLKATKPAPLIDVRSPKEYIKGHIPGALHIPVFDDEERARVGIQYKQEGREAALGLAMELVAPKKQEQLDKVRKVAKGGRITLYCWRGGMRSAKFAEFLSGNGVDVTVIEGGYKAYRRLLTATFEKTWKLLVIGGKTGSGKTELLQLLGEMGHQVIDLERIAHHKGSAFGHMGQTPQPTTEQFQNNLWEEWNKFDDELPVLIEDESQAIGTIRIPDTLYKQMRMAQILNLEVDREERVERLVREYACFKDIALKENTLKLSKRLGGLEVKKAVCAIDQGDYHSVVRIVLAYYDKAYAFGLATREIATVNHLRLSKDDPLKNSKLIDEFISENKHKLWTRSSLPNTVMVQDAAAR